MRIKKSFHAVLILSCIISCNILAMPFVQLPEPVSKAVTPAIKTLFSESIDQLNFEVLHGGYSKDILYKLCLDDKSYVFKISISSNSKSISKEIFFTSLASKYNLSPKLFYPDKEAIESNVMLIQYINSIPLTVDTYRRYNNQIIQRMKILHQIADPSIPKARNMFKRTRSKLKKTKLPINLDNVFKQFENIEQAVLPFQKFNTLVHNDLNLNNILVSQKKVYFIDWVDAGLGDPITDLAYYTVLSGMSSQESLQALKIYFGSNIPSKPEVAQFLLMRKISYLYLVAFAFEHYVPESIEQLPQVNISFSEILNGIYSGTFKLDTDENWAIYAAVSLREFQRDPEETQQHIFQLQH